MMNGLTVLAQTTSAVKQGMALSTRSVAQYGPADDAVTTRAAIRPKVQDN